MMSTRASESLLNPNPAVTDKATLRQILEEQDKQTGFIHDPNATPQQARALMLTQGIHPEDNAFSCEIRRAREGE